MKPAPQKYRTTNWKTYNEALKVRGSLLIWLDPKDELARPVEWQARAQPDVQRRGDPVLPEYQIRANYAVGAFDNFG
jgi:hypothetical protein